MAADAPARRGLGRASRIKLGRDFQKVRVAGQRLVRGSLIANWLLVSGAERSRLGVVVSKKVGGAVVRSQVKRLLRESFRLHQYEFVQPLDLVLVARPSMAGRTFAEVEHNFLSTLRSAGLLK
jgi:ribonuclease P protein component